MAFRLTSRSNGNVSKSLAALARKDHFSNLDRFGRQGVDALRSVTPIASGLTANSWGYRIVKERGRISVEWFNTNSAAGTPIALLIQYGHGTGTGGYVPGKDYINPAIKPIFDRILEDVWRQVK